jgi:hypothetical protein
MVAGVTFALLIGTAQAGLTDGMIAYYPFNPSDVVPTDYAGSHNGVLSGSPLPQKGPDIVKNPTAAYQFKPDGYINVPTMKGLYLSTYSFVSWFTVNEMAHGNMIVTKGQSGEKVCSIWLWVDEDGHVVGEHEPGVPPDNPTHDGPAVVAKSAVTVEEGLWYGVALTYNGTDLTLYLGNACGCDFLDVDKVPAERPGDLNPGALFIGANGEHDLFFRGSIDEVRIFDRALSEEEVRYYITGCVPEPGTVGLLGLGALVLRRRRR